MAYRSVDEIEQFSFEDCQISKVEKTPDGICFVVDALIVRPQNSQNTQFTESYADTAAIQIEQVSNLRVAKEGYRYYDADDRLIEEVPDQPLNEEEITAVLRQSSGAYLFEVQSQGENLTMRVEFADATDQDPLASTTYEFKMQYKEIVITWDKYLNRVQH
ncbi:MAG: hypothetical protein K6G01_05670 [Eubacterium sp.]|nr:hypothetical protein [Eubacterium sp.]